MTQFTLPHFQSLFTGWHSQLKLMYQPNFPQTLHLFDAGFSATHAETS